MNNNLGTSQHDHSPLLHEMVSARKDAIIERLNLSSSPPWRPISSRQVSQLLRVSLQSLANWRVRETGPEPEVRGTGRGNRIYYRPDKILTWIRGGPWWIHSAAWLADRGLGVDVVCEESVTDRIALLEGMDVFR